MFQVPPLVAFFLYLIASSFILVTAVFIYTKVTPYNEFQLIRNGNTAAAISLGGAMIGFALPLANLIAHSVTLKEVVVWSVFTLGAQLLTYFFTDQLMFKGLRSRIEAGETAAAVALAAISISVGLINAACLTT